MQSITDENKAIVARFNKEFIEGGDMQAFNDIIAEDLVNQTVPPSVPKGPEGVFSFSTIFLKPAFPDLTVHIHDQLGEGDKVTTRKSFHATHKGDFFRHTCI